MCRVITLTTPLSFFTTKCTSMAPLSNYFPFIRIFPLLFPSYISPILFLSSLSILIFSLPKSNSSDSFLLSSTCLSGKKSKPKMGAGESVKFLANSPYIRDLAALVVGYGMAINIVEVRTSVVPSYVSTSSSLLSSSVLFLLFSAVT